MPKPNQDMRIARESGRADAGDGDQVQERFLAERKLLDGSSKTSFFSRPLFSQRS